MKIVIFDLDETLGYFTQFGILWDCLNKYLYKNNTNNNIYLLNQNIFNNILNLYPEFIRPNIINILKYLVHQKKTLICGKIMIYTNNQGPKEWVNYIIKYFENEINYPLFDQLISAFKQNGKILEICRTSTNKSYKDLIKCTKIPKNTEICFIDDSFYPEMTNDSIYYIIIKPYYYDLKIETMIERLINSKILNNFIIDMNDFQDKIMTNYKKYNYPFIFKTNEEYEIDKILGRQIMTHLEFFFTKSDNSDKINETKKNKTKRNKITKNKTKKNHYFSR
jgi:hypothetical protein